MTIIYETDEEAERRTKLQAESLRAPFGFYRPHNPRATAFDNLHLDPKTGELVPMESMTKQSEMEACDIHNILKQYSQQGFEQLVRERAAQGQYMDLPADIDYQTSLNTVIAAQAAFAALPSQVRSRFQNDPGQFIEFLADPANQDEAIRLGLAQDTRTPEAPPQKVEIVNSAPPEPVEGNRGVKGG